MGTLSHILTPHSFISTILQTELDVLAVWTLLDFIIAGEDKWDEETRAHPPIIFYF